MTGLIYIAIIALWAAVLIPMWLRRHDQISEVRSTARFSSAMRSLAGQGQPLTAEMSYAATDTVQLSRPTSGASRPEVRPMRPTTEDRAPGLDPTYERELARQSAATRRAVILGTLTVVLLVALVLAIAGTLPRWTPIVAALPVVAFVLASALTASGRSASRADSRGGARREARRAPRPTARDEGRAVDERADPMAPAAGAAVDDWETWNAWDDEESWDAVPTTLPTYVTAARASAVPRGIDRSRPGEWTGSAMVETAQSMRRHARSEALSRPPADIDHHAETAELPSVRDDYSDRRAVNE